MSTKELCEQYTDEIGENRRLMIPSLRSVQKILELLT